MKNAKKALILVLCAALLVGASVMGTLAFLQDETGPVTNTFTVGNVTITMDEAKVTEYGVVDGTDRVTTNTYKLIPGHTYVKDPTIYVGADSEYCYLFVKITNEIAAIEDGTTIAAHMANNGWTLIDVDNGIWAKNDAVSKGDKIVVFESFKIKGDAKVADYNAKAITIIAYAVQKDGFDTAQAAWNATFGA